MAEDGEPDLPKEKLPSKNLLPESVWGQLKRLGRRAIPDAYAQTELSHTYSHTHLGSAQEMCQITKDCSSEVLSFLGTEVNEKDLQFMILIGDIGKAGAEKLLPGEEPVIVRLYTDLFLHKDHGDWIRNHRDVSEYPSTMSSTSISFLRSEEVNSPVNFVLAPTELSLYVAQQVAIEQHPDQKEDLENRFSCTEEEKEQLKEKGFPIETTPMATFFTKLHIVEGERFMNSLGNELTDEQKKKTIEGLSHHFSQNVLPKGISKIDLTNKTTMKTIAYLEILDKVNAWVNRSNYTPEDALLTAKKLVMGNLARNKHAIPNCPSDVEKTYEEVFDFFARSSILAKLK